MARSLGEIRKEHEVRMTALFEKTGTFFAFSNEQFEKNKTPLREGEKYVALGNGGYLPKGNVEAFHAGFEEIDKWYDGEIADNGLGEEEVMYEIHNHQCYYTGDFEDVIEMFEGKYTREEIMKIAYSKQKEG